MDCQTASPPQTPPNRLIRLPHVLDRLGGISKDTLDHMVARGEFPAPVTISHRSRAWSIAEVDEWINAKLETRKVA